MKINEHNPSMFKPLAGHGELAQRLTAIRQEEREQGARYPHTTEAVIRQWEKEQGYK